MEQFRIWRGEIEAELATAEAAIAAATDGVGAATERLTAARLDYTSLCDAAENARGSGYDHSQGRQRQAPLSNAVAGRLQAARGPLSAAEGDLVRAKLELANANWRAEDLRDALAEIQRITPPEPATIEVEA